MTLILILLLAVVHGGSSVDFEEFVATFQKKYSTMEEKNYRRAIYGMNQKEIHLLNKQHNPQTTYGVNKFSDLTKDEFRASHGYRAPSAVREMTYDRSFIPSNTFPSAWDWRSHGAVTAVKDQAQCGSCWAFSTVGGIEGQHFLAGFDLTALSEQELVSCDTIDTGCDGGDIGSAMQWLVRSNDGWLTSEKDYPYTSGGGVNGTCLLPKPKVAHIYAHVDIPSNETVMADYLQQNGPLAVCVDAASWQSYSGGILKGCGLVVDHCVTTVGYNLANNPPYWIVKNSWNTDWGIDGYIYIEFGKNLCNINSEPRRALVEKVGPTPPPTPQPPSPTPVPRPDNSSYVQYSCAKDSNCVLASCTKETHHSGECVSNFDGNVSAIAHCDNVLGFLRVVNYAGVGCKSSSQLVDQDLNMCFNFNENYYYNVCPHA